MSMSAVVDGKGHIKDDGTTGQMTGQLFSALYSYNCSNSRRKQQIRGQEILYQIHTAFVVVTPSNSYIRH